MATELPLNIRNQIQHWGESAMRTVNLIKKNALDVFDVTIKEWVKKTHPLMAKEIQSIWEDVYGHCGNESGE